MVVLWALNIIFWGDLYLFIISIERKLINYFDYISESWPKLTSLITSLFDWFLIVSQENSFSCQCRKCGKYAHWMTSSVWFRRTPWCCSQRLQRCLSRILPQQATSTPAKTAVKPCKSKTSSKSQCTPTSSTSSVTANCRRFLARRSELIALTWQ